MPAAQPCMSPVAKTKLSLVRDASVKEEIRNSLTQSGIAFNRGDVEAIVRAYAPDAVVLPPNGPAVHGTVAIRQLWASLLLAGYCNAALDLDLIEHRNNVAIAIGRYKVQIPLTRETFEIDRGKYVGHWRRMPDGQFRVTSSIWYSDRWLRLAHTPLR